MTTLFWPGDHRDRELMSEAAFVAAMVTVEQSWLELLVERRVAPATADLGAVAIDREQLAVEAEAGGNPVIPLVRALRADLPDDVAPWVHRGLTSQDVVDTALVLCARDAVVQVRRQLHAQVEVLVELATRHRGAPLLARTLTQPAVPTTVGLKVAGWLHGVLDADDLLADLRWPVQLGGAAGTLASVVELAGVEGARGLRTGLARALGLEPAPPWHTRRTTVTRIGDAAVTASDGWGRLANDVLVLGRPEVGELRDGSAGGSSTMSHKANPTLAVLVRRAAIAAPHLAAALHSAAAEQVDERADGAWHVEWRALAQLLRQTVVAASQATDLLRGLVVHPERAAARLAEVDDDARAEQRSLAALTGRDPLPSYDGLADDLVDEALARARRRSVGADPEENP